MRRNVVIDGQLFSKDSEGLRSHYQPQFFAKEGVLVTIGMIIFPFIILVVSVKILPMFRSVEEAYAAGRLIEEDSENVA